MNYLLMAENGIFAKSGLSKLTKSDCLILLIALDKSNLSSEFEMPMKKMVKEAENLKNQLEIKGIKTKVQIEWASEKEAIANCLDREGAILLK